MQLSASQNNVIGNPFSCACDIRVCDRLWYMYNLKQVKKHIGVLAPQFPGMNIA
jgi:hypothetical protein